MEKIFPLNLTARAAALVPGNPVTTRLEGGVGNCFPGLEFDHRNLDRRFFPGLVFEFGSSQGAPLVKVNPGDPDLDPKTFEGLSSDAPDPGIQSVLRTALGGHPGKLLLEGSWVLDSIAQAGRTIAVRDLAGLTVWRLVRSLEPGPVEIALARSAGTPRKMALKGWRRRFVSTKTGVISEAFQPGELTQSLCSPWMHDFRDCACTYWASNHPDIVLAEQPPGAEPDPVREETPIDWLRSDRAPARTAAAVGTESGNRAAQMDHYEINERWQDLSIVLLGHEIASAFPARESDAANPFETADELAKTLVGLATLEHAVALEYLYAMYSVKEPAKAAGQSLKDAVTFVQHEMLVIAVSEMRHLRWANQLLWELEHAGLTTKRFGPSLGIAAQVPGVNGLRAPELRVLDGQTLDDFIAVEKPSGTLDGAYARVLATLRRQPPYPAPLEQLAGRILADGMQHYTRFREIKRVLEPFSGGNPPAYLQTITKASRAEARTAVGLYAGIIADLQNAYESGDMEDAALIGRARTTMFELDAAADALASAGKGVPFF
jgi:Ferritin-like